MATNSDVGVQEAGDSPADSVDASNCALPLSTVTLKRPKIAAFANSPETVTWSASCELQEPYPGLPGFCSEFDLLVHRLNVPQLSSFAVVFCPKGNSPWLHWVMGAGEGKFSMENYEDPHAPVGKGTMGIFSFYAALDHPVALLISSADAANDEGVASLSVNQSCNTSTIEAKDLPAYFPSVHIGFSGEVVEFTARLSFSITCPHIGSKN